MARNSFVEVSLDEIADFRNGKAIPPEKYTLAGKHPVFGSNGEIARSDEVLYLQPAIVIGRVGAYCGCVHYVPTASWVTDNAIVALPKDGNDIRYLYYLLSSLELQRTAIGSAQPLMTQGGLKVVRTKAPPIAEQRAISAVLGALDDKIDLNRRTNATLETMARTLFQSWFVDFDPIRAKLDGCPPGVFDPAAAALFPEHLEDSPIGKKPIGWSVTVLEDVLAVLETGGRPKGGVGGITGGVPSIGAESIVSVGVFDFGKTKFVPVEFYEGMRKGHIESHDVLLYKDGGRPGEYEPHVSMFGDGFPFEHCSINEHVYRLRTNERLSQEFLYFWMTSEFALAEMRIKGTGVAIPD